ncbi:MAG: response regulator transcription factor [Pseudomonadota bacterium]
MKRTWILYGLALAVGTFLLQWLEFRYMTHMVPELVYVFIVAVGFTAIGIYAGTRLTSPAKPTEFTPNENAIATLGITPRERETLSLIAEGLANKEIARRLGVSPNTVKTHVSKLYEKLGARRRTEALARARELSLIE